jgi:hypothetical protein
MGHSSAVFHGLALTEEKIMNTFEKSIHDLIDGYAVEFFSGTLFLQGNEDDARSVFHKLTEYLGLGNVIVSKVTDGEYAYDFI